MLLVLNLGLPAFADDTYNDKNGQLYIPMVRAFGNIYRDVVVQVKDVIAVNGGNSENLMDSYDSNTNLLSIPAVTAFGKTYTNVVISIGSVISVSKQSSSVSINYYGREPNIAYPTNVTSNIANLKTQFAPGDQLSGPSSYLQVSFDLDGYQSTWSPLLLTEKSNLQLGLYRTSQIKKQSNFAKGIIPHDLGGWLMGAYDAGYFPTTFDRIKKINGNTVVYADSAFIDRLDFTNNIVSFKGMFFPPDSVVMDMGTMAKSRGLNFMMMIGIYPGDAFVQEFYKNIYTIPTSNDVFWNAWFDAYKKILVERAVLAQKAGVTNLAIGFNLGYMVDKGNDKWSSLIASIRASGFTGDISYFAGTNQQYNELSNISDDYKRSQFMSLFNQVGLNIYNPVFALNSQEILSNDQSLERIKSSIFSQLASLPNNSTPIYFMIGTPSVHGGAVSNAYIEPGLPCSNYISTQIKDYQQQADVYEAVAQIVNAQQNTTTKPIKGIFSWGYHYRDDLRTIFTQDDSCFDYSASIRNKPAEAVLNYWFQGW